MGLIIFGLKMMDIRDFHKARRIRFGGVELSFLSVEARNAAREAIVPCASFSGGETDHEPAVAVAKGVH